MSRSVLVFYKIIEMAKGRIKIRKRGVENLASFRVLSSRTLERPNGRMMVRFDRGRIYLNLLRDAIQLEFYSITFN